MILFVSHATSYTYSGSAIESYNEIRLTPTTDETQALISFDIETDPSANIFRYHELGGDVDHFNHLLPHTSLQINARAIVNTLLTNPFESLNLTENDWGDYSRYNLNSMFSEYLSPTLLVPRETVAAELSKRAKQMDGTSVATYLLALNKLLSETIEYRQGATTVHSTLHEVLQDMSGVCQDFSHVMLAACRYIGIPSRYVSGYLYTAPGRETLHADEAMHAWVECLLPDGNWHGFDPTNNLMADDRYIKAHVGRDYNDVTPVKGVYRGAASHEMNVYVTVREATSTEHL